MKHGKGAIKDKPDKRDYTYNEIAKSSLPFDWEKGYEIPVNLTLKNQNGSFSCGGQAWAYYGQTLDPEHEEKSAKFIYAHTAVKGGGSDGRTNCEFVKNKGWGSEKLTPSYDNGNPAEEPFYTRLQDITEEAYNHAKTDRAYSYALVKGGIDIMAQAIRDNQGLIIIIEGQDNGTWLSQFPKIPSGKNGLWYHWLYVVGAEMINGKKYLKAINSWGAIGENGYQYFGEDWMKHIWYGWTLVYNDTPVDEVKFTGKNVMLYGQSSEEIKNLQMILQKDGCFPQGYPCTGNYYEMTQKAVMKFQLKYNVASYLELMYVNGKRVGFKTLKKLTELYG